MIVTVIHNPRAGDGEPTREALLDALRAAGHEPRYQSTRADDFPSALQEPGDVVLVAGGDGTVQTAALELATRGVPMAVVPMGTANNIATSLGLQRELDAIVKAVRAGREQQVDLGSSAGPWGERRFIEGAGFGVVPELIRVIDRYAAAQAPDAMSELRYARRVLDRVAALLPPFECRVHADGETHVLRPILLEVMNVQRIGPGLPIAPTADPTDGLLEVVWVEEPDREALRGAIRAWAAADEAIADAQHATSFGCRNLRAAEVRIECNAPLAHIDDDLWKAKKKHRPGYEAVFTCERGAVRLLR